jgi:hypothetical protein
VPRRTWLDKIDVFLEELAASSMHLDRQHAGELITGQVRAVATLMRVTERTETGHSVASASMRWNRGFMAVWAGLSPMAGHLCRGRLSALT